MACPDREVGRLPLTQKAACKAYGRSSGGTANSISLSEVSLDPSVASDALPQRQWESAKLSEMVLAPDAYDPFFDFLHDPRAPVHCPTMKLCRRMAIIIGLGLLLVSPVKTIACFRSRYLIQINQPIHFRR